MERQVSKGFQPNSPSRENPQPVVNRVRAVGRPRLLFLTRPLMKGSDVKVLQKKLIDLEYNIGEDGADGFFGEDTAKAVIKFQEDKDIDPINGIVGDRTLHALGL